MCEPPNESGYYWVKDGDLDEPKILHYAKGKTLYDTGWSAHDWLEGLWPHDYEYTISEKLSSPWIDIDTKQGILDL